MKYKLVIFDLDGTILDTLENLTYTMNHVLTENHMPARSRDEIRRATGNGIHYLVENSVEEGTSEKIIEKAFDDFNKYYSKHCCDHTGPYSGIIDCMRKIKQSGTKIAIVSNKADYAVQELCEEFFKDMFDFAVGEKEGIRRKPYPDSVRHVLEIMDVCEEDAVYVGDSEVDIETAANAGINEISVVWGFREAEFLRKQGAKVIVETPQELLKTLE